MNKLPYLLRRFALLCLIFSSTLYAAQGQYQGITNNPVEPLLVSHATWLNELSERRQTSTLIPNQQSMFNGISYGYVNTSKLNVTFSRRDMVVVGRMPLVFARVYDSSYAGGDDFAQGWHLSIAQTIQTQANGDLQYLDDTGTFHLLAQTASGFNIKPLQHTEVKAVTFNAQGQLQIDYATGWSKTFAKMGDRYRLVKIVDNNDNKQRLHYVNNRLSKIVGDNNRFIALVRNTAGYVSSIVDDQNRTVSFNYNRHGLLSAVTDLGENRWLYHYQGKRLLGKVIDPLGQVAAKFSYGIAGKVTSAKVRAQKNTFKQQGNTTVAKNAKSQQVTFVHNAAGIVTSVTNADGLTSRIELNRQRQPIELWHNNKKQAQFDYDINGDLIRVEQVKVEYRYQYNAFGRIVLTSGSDGTTTAYKYDAKGNLLKDISPTLEKTYRYANNGDLVSETEYFTGLAINTTYYEYNADGLLSKLVSGELQTRFAYSVTGRLAQVTFPDGAIHQYEHDKLGFRVRTKRSDKSQVKYAYDTVGNLRESIKLNDGQLVNEGTGNTLKLNSANQVIEIKTKDQPPMKVVYSALGHPVQINKGEKQINYGYDRSGRLTQVDDSQSGVSQYTYETNEQGLRAQFDTRTSRTKSPQSQLTHHNQSQSQLLYTHMIGSPWQAVTWSDSQVKLLVVEPSQFGAANAGFESAKQRQRLFDAKSTLKQGQLNFDKPSNAMFPAPEYIVANCDIEGDNEDDLSDCIIHGVLLNPAGGVVVGQAYTFSAYALSGIDCAPQYRFAIDGAIAGYSHTGLFSYTFEEAGSHSVQVLAECACGGYFVWDFSNIDAACPIDQASLTGGCVTAAGIDGPSQLTLIDDYTLTATVQPTNAQIDKYQFEIKRSTSQQWYTLYSGTQNAYASYAKVAGHFMVRLRLFSNNNEYLSQAQPLEMMFPIYAKVVADASVQVKTAEVWRAILAETNVLWRREKGLWVSLNTATKKYEFSEVVNGPRVADDERGTIDLPALNDSNLSPTPLDTLTYVVASFHGHTPTLYTTKRRRVGASQADFIADEKAGITGIVFDYVATEPNNEIPIGLPLNSPAALYHVPGSYRITPE